jgi:hypothetical protein
MENKKQEIPKGIVGHKKPRKHLAMRLIKRGRKTYFN